MSLHDRTPSRAARRTSRQLRRPQRPSLLVATAVLAALAVAAPARAVEPGPVVAALPQAVVEVSVTSDTVVAVVSAPASDLPQPTGTVEFEVDGVPVGTAPVVGDRATLRFHVPTGGSARHIAAFSSGDGAYMWGLGTYDRVDPAINAYATPSEPRFREHRAGEPVPLLWYAEPVTVRFGCWSFSSRVPLLSCPAPVTLDRSGAGQSVSGTALAADGGAGTARIDGLNIDLVPPTVELTGVREGATYLGGAPSGGCRAADTLSGVLICHVRRVVDGEHVTYVTDAVDNAGNTVVGDPVEVWASSLVLDGTDREGQDFVVRGGRTYALLAASTSRPQLLSSRSTRVASGRAVRAKRGFRAAGHRRWSASIKVPRSARPGDRITVSTRLGGHTKRVVLRVTG